MHDKNKLLISQVENQREKINNFIFHLKQIIINKTSKKN